MRGNRLGVRLEEVVQNMEEGQNVVLVAAELRIPNIIDNHIAHFFGPMLFREKVACQSRCRNFGDVLVFGDGEHFFLGQPAKTRCNPQA